MRVVEVIPGKSVMGLEIPNEKREIVTLGEIIKSKAYDDVRSPLALALGKDIGGNPDRARTSRRCRTCWSPAPPAPANRSRINAMILSLLYKSTAEHVRLIMIDPEDAGALGVRGHPASARARRHRHEARRQRAALVRGGDGAALRS